MPKSKTTEVAVKVRPSQTRQFMSFIRTTGQDAEGREVAPNGIRWKLADA